MYNTIFITCNKLTSTLRVYCARYVIYCKAEEGDQFYYIVLKKFEQKDKALSTIAYFYFIDDMFASQRGYIAAAVSF